MGSIHTSSYPTRNECYKFLLLSYYHRAHRERLDLISKGKGLNSGVFYNSNTFLEPAVAKKYHREDIKSIAKPCPPGSVTLVAAYNHQESAPSLKPPSATLPLDRQGCKLAPHTIGPIGLSPRSPTKLSPLFKIQSHSPPPQDLSLPSSHTKRPSQASLFPKSPRHSALSSSTQSFPFPSELCQFPQSFPSPSRPHQSSLSPSRPHQSSLSPSRPHQSSLSPSRPHQSSLSPSRPHQSSLSPSRPHQSFPSSNGPHQSSVSANGLCQFPLSLSRPNQFSSLPNQTWQPSHKNLQSFSSSNGTSQYSQPSTSPSGLSQPTPSPNRPFSTLNGHRRLSLSLKKQQSLARDIVTPARYLPPLKTKNLPIIQLKSHP